MEEQPKDNDRIEAEEHAGDEAPPDVEAVEATETADAYLIDEEEGVARGAREKPEMVEELKAEAKENFDKYLRALADLENFKKRSVKERSDIVKYSGENIVRDLLEIVDNFERALQQKTGSTEEILTGIRLIYERFLAILNGYSIRAESAVGLPFDPSKHDALSTVKTGEKPAGTVIDELKKAYFYKDKLLRPGQVVVAAQPDEAVPPVEEATNGTDLEEGKGGEQTG